MSQENLPQLVFYYFLANTLLYAFCLGYSLWLGKKLKSVMHIATAQFIVLKAMKQEDNIGFAALVRKQKPEIREVIERMDYSG